jgi:hypothetical protein
VGTEKLILPVLAREVWAELPGVLREIATAATASIPTTIVTNLRTNRLL